MAGLGSKGLNTYLWLFSRYLNDLKSHMSLEEGSLALCSAAAWHLHQSELQRRFWCHCTIGIFLTCKFRTAGARLEQHGHTCSIHHFKGKMLNMNIFAIS